MASRVPPEALYRETLEATRSEIQDLTNEIRMLRERLDHLVKQKSAVSDVYEAVRKLVELNDDDDETVEYEAIGLSEEEVSLIAYPDGNANRRA